MRSSFAVLASLALITTAACGGDDTGAADAATDAAPIDVAVDAEAPFVPPTMLSETGLYSDLANQIVAPDVIEFAPRWQLWSDDAAKRRWISLPAGQIDTTDMNWWVFPRGTRIWKEFSRGGVRIETRFMQKIGDGNTFDDWFFVSFQWGAGADAIAVPNGVVDDTGVNDIPARSDCRKCHTDTRNPSLVLGFSALQLDAPPPNSGAMSLERLVTEGLLTAPPSNGGLPGTPFFPLPANTDLATSAFGYLHANCGGCHNLRSDVQLTVPLVLRQDVTELTSWATTRPYMTTVDVVPTTVVPGATRIIKPGIPAESALYYRLTSNAGQRMPPVGRETVDPIGSEAVRAWIASLP